MTLARSHYEEDLKTEEAEHGQWHSHVGITLNNLGRTLKAQGNTKDAYIHFLQALEVALRSCILGDLLSDLGGYSEARSHYRRAQQIMESLSGKNHLDVAIILNSLGNTARAQGESAEARSFFARARGIFRDNLGGEHPYTKIAQEHLDALPQTPSPEEILDDDDNGFYL